MKISVVIPAYNEEKYISRTLESMKNQNFKGFEVIVSDGGSTDKTRDIAKKYGYKVVVSRNQTIPFARQKGVEASTGEIITGADADTFYPPDHLEMIYSDFALDTKIVAVGGPSDFPKTPWWVYMGWRFVYDFLNRIKVAMHMIPYIPAFNLSFRRSAFDKIGGYRTYIDYGGDELDIITRLSKIGKIRYDDKLRPLSSNRRSSVGLFKFLFKEGLVDYYLGYFLAKVFHRTVIKGRAIR